MTGPLTTIGSGPLAALQPMLERALSIEPACDVRLRVAGQLLSAFVRLPFDVLAGCTLDVGPTSASAGMDVTVAAAELLDWCSRAASVSSAARAEEPTARAEPQRRDAHWLTALPPRDGWRRLELVPGEVVQRLVRSGAELAPAAASRTAQQSLLESTVLTASSSELSVEVPLGVLSGLVRMGFLPPDGAAAIDVHRGWLRVAARFGSTYRQRGGAGLDVFGGLLG